MVAGVAARARKSHFAQASADGVTHTVPGLVYCFRAGITAETVKMEKTMANVERRAHVIWEVDSWAATEP
jgi:hypothetical protein